MRRTLIAVLFLVLVINYVDRASCQTNTTNTTTTNTTTTNTTNTTGNSTTNTTTNSTTNSTANSTTNTTGTNTTANTTTGANTTTNTPTTVVNNIAFFKANGTALTAVNTYNSQTVKAGKSLYIYFQLTASSQPKATVYILPADVGSVYSSGFRLKLTTIIQPTAASGVASLVSTSFYDGNALTGTATISADSYLMAQIDNQDTVNDYTVLVNFVTSNYTLLSPMGTVSNTRKGATTATLTAAWDIYEMYVPTINVKVLMRLFSCMGGAQMFYAASATDAANIAKTPALQSADIVPNNSLEMTYSAVSTVYIVVNPYSGSTQSDGTYSNSYTLDAAMYNSSTVLPYANFVPGGNGYINYTRNSDSSVQFSWSPVISASSDFKNQVVTYSLYVANTQDNFTNLLSCGPVTLASTDSATTWVYNTTTTTVAAQLNPSNTYYVGVVAAVNNYAVSPYQNNIPVLYVPYTPTSYNYVKPSSSDSNPAGLGVTVFFLVLLIIIVIILAIVLYTKYKARKNGELGGATTTANRAAATTTAAAATKTAGKAVSPPQSAMPVLPKDEPKATTKKADVKYAPPPEPAPAIKVDHLKDDHGLQQVDHHYEVEQQVPENYDYQPDNQYQGEEYNAGANQDDYNPDAYAGQGHADGEYEVPNDQHEVSPDNEHHGHGH